MLIVMIGEAVNAVENLFCKRLTGKSGVWGDGKLLYDLVHGRLLVGGYLYYMQPLNQYILLCIAVTVSGDISFIAETACILCVNPVK